MGTNNIIKKDNKKLNNKIISHSDSHNSIMAPLTSQVKEQETNIKGTVIGRVKVHIRFEFTTNAFTLTCIIKEKKMNLKASVSRIIY